MDETRQAEIALRYMKARISGVGVITSKLELQEATEVLGDLIGISYEEAEEFYKSLLSEEEVLALVDDVDDDNLADPSNLALPPEE